MAQDWTNIQTFISKLDSCYDSKQADLITKHRKEFGGTLFFDRIYNSLGLGNNAPSANKVYPPSSVSELKSLWSKIAKTDESQATNERKQAVLFYILRDCRQASVTSSKSAANTLGDVDVRFADAMYLPRKYITLVSGLWELDHAQFSTALGHLTNPIVGTDFTAEIAQALLSHPKCDRELALAYFNAKMPPLSDQKITEGVFGLLLDQEGKGGVAQAYEFTRKQIGERRKLLFVDLVEDVLSADVEGAERAERTRLLVSLPLTKQEDAWMEEFLLHGGGSKLQGAKDIIIMRRLACGKATAGTAALDGYRGQRIDGVNWDDVRLGWQSAAS